jgi:hypothetical protein
LTKNTTNGVEQKQELLTPRDTLVAPDAHSNETTPNIVATHSVNQPRRQRGACRANRVPVRHGTAFDMLELMGDKSASIPTDLR